MHCGTLRICYDIQYVRVSGAVHLLNDGLTALMRGVQRFVCLDEQESVGAADRDRQVLVDLC